MISEDAIRKRSYRIWQLKGCPEGQDQQNWLEAKAQLETEMRAGGLRFPKDDAAPQVPSRPRISERPRICKG
jgi:Protein of unknown function (DUF2934)